MSLYDKLPSPIPDDLPTPEVGEWGRQKYLRAWTYDCIFSTGMKNRYRNRVYIDLFAGAGKAKIQETGELLVGSPLLALSVPDRFTKYILCEKIEQNYSALKARVESEHPAANVTCLHGKVETLIPRIISEIPPGWDTLSFCFVDPFDLTLDFEIIKQLSAGRRMDFLILLAAQMDGQRNESVYVQPGNQKIEKLLADPDWRPKREESRNQGVGFQQFLMERYLEAMRGIGYVIPRDRSNVYTVKTESKGVPIYYLLYFSKHERGYDFWRKADKSSTAQRSLFD